MSRVVPATGRIWGWMLLCLPGLATAVGLGPLELRSWLHQPLEARIALRAAPGEALDDLQATVADAARYEARGLHRPAVLERLRLRVERDAAGGAQVVVSSREPVSEPLLHLVVELRTAAGRLQREYPLLLDPPPANTPAHAAPAREPTPAAPPARQRVVTVRRGESLSGIAQRLRPTGITVAQMTLALYNENREQFRAQNMNALEAGKRLQIPAEETVRAIDPNAANREVRQQYVAWKARRTKTAERAPVEPETPAEAQRTDATPETEKASVAETEPTAAAETESEPQLRLLTPDSPMPAGKDGAGDLAEALQNLQESKAAAEERNSRLRARLLEVEAQVATLAERLLAAQEREAAPETVAESAPATKKPTPPPPAPSAPAAEPPAEPSAVAWWRDPVWWVVILGAAVVLVVAAIAGLLWRRYRQWQYREFMETLGR